MSNFPLVTTEVHPINGYRPPSAPSAYKLLKWKPIYDMIVAGHIVGRSNVQLSEDFDFTPQHISNILRCDHAQSLIKAASDNIRMSVIEKSNEDVDVHLDIQTKALERVQNFVNDDELALKHPFAFIDRIKGLAKGELVNVPAASTQAAVTVNVQTNNQINNVRDESLARIAKAIEISDG